MSYHIWQRLPEPDALFQRIHRRTMSWSKSRMIPAYARVQWAVMNGILTEDEAERMMRLDMYFAHRDLMAWATSGEPVSELHAPPARKDVRPHPLDS